MKKVLTYSLILGTLSFFLSNCASLTGFHDGKTLGQGNGEFSASLSYNATPAFKDIDDGVDSISTDIPSIGFPNLEFGGRYGINEKVDLTLRLNTSLNLGFGAKVQVVGDRDSKVALALGAEIGSFGLILPLWNVQVPVYFSVHPSEKFTWYATPKYIYQFSTVGEVTGGARYVGANTGLLFGSKNKFGIDFGYFNAGIDGATTGLFQFGIGGRFAFGNN
jgi:hypothetical protein